MRTYKVIQGPRCDYPRTVLWRWRNNGGTCTLLEAAFTSYFLRTVSWVIRQVIFRNKDFSVQCIRPDRNGSDRIGPDRPNRPERNGSDRKVVYASFLAVSTFV